MSISLFSTSSVTLSINVKFGKLLNYVVTSTVHLAKRGFKLVIQTTYYIVFDEATGLLAYNVCLLLT